MRVRPDKYYVVLCERKESSERIEVDECDSQELIYLVCDTLQERLNAPKDENGKYKKGIPYTKLSVIEFDKRTKRNKTLTSGPVYNLSPIQVKERLAKAIKEKS